MINHTYFIIIMPEYIYLLQEREAIRLNEPVYKVGKTKQENLKRISSYPNGTELLIQIKCDNCDAIEKDLIKLFKEKYEQKTDMGTEYFEGDSNEMIKDIYKAVFKDDSVESCIQYRNKMIIKISEVFPCYKNDESFGGNKKYIIIKKINNQYVVYYIIPNLDEMCTNYDIENIDVIDTFSFNENVADKLQYFKLLITKNIIFLNTIYDINSTKFIEKINNLKFKIKLENYDEFKEYITNSEYYCCKIHEKIRNYLMNNMIINDKLFVTIAIKNDTENIFKKFKNLNNDFDNFSIDVGIDDYNIIYLIKINAKYYENDTYLRKYIPYLIRCDIENNYYILNRDYEYIGLNTKYIEDEKERKSEFYLFNDATSPFQNKQNFSLLYNNYKSIITNNVLKKCLNSNKFTEDIINESRILI
jgi:hypothetical protein